MNEFNKDFSKCHCNESSFPQEWNFEDCTCSGYRKCPQSNLEHFYEEPDCEEKEFERRPNNNDSLCHGFCGECCCQLKWQDENKSKRNCGCEANKGCDEKPEKVDCKHNCKCDKKEDDGYDNRKQRCCRRGLFCFRFFR